jgi:phosphoheptose isomerase
MSVDRVRAYLLEMSDLARRTADACAADVTRAAELLVDALRDGAKILLCGNGGSAADSQHLAAEFVSVLTLDNRRPAIPAIALTTDTSILTAIANDFGFEGVFARQVEALGRPGDVVVGISTSGESPNVLRAVETARRLGCFTVALTGGTGGSLARAADEAFVIPSGETPRIQEAHIPLGHALCALVEDLMFPPGEESRSPVG